MATEHIITSPYNDVGKGRTMSIEAPRIGELDEEGRKVAEKLRDDLVGRRQISERIERGIEFGMTDDRGSCLWVVPAKTLVWLFPKLGTLLFWLEATEVAQVWVTAEGGVHAAQAEDMAFRRP